MTRRLLTVAALLSATTAIAVVTPTRKPNVRSQADKPSIAAQAAAIIKAKCVECHSGAFAFDANKPATLIAKKHIVAGKSAASNAFIYMSGKEKAMPPKPKTPLTAAELAIVKQWIDEGAKPADAPAASTTPKTGGIDPVPSTVKENASGDTSATATRALEIIKNNCTGCHAGSQYFDAANPKAMLKKGYFVGGDPDGSIGLQFVLGKMTGRSYKQMPPEPSPALSTVDQAVIAQWVKDGANMPSVSIGDSSAGGTATPKPATEQSRTAVTEEQVLRAITADIDAVEESERKYMRYYSIANLQRNPDFTAADLKDSRIGLEKLINSLSWAPDIVRLKPLGPDNTVLRLDLRTVDWTDATWQRIVAVNPYGLLPKNAASQVDTIRRQTGAAFPYIRADWFVATASVPPLYHEILELPDNVADLEKRLGVTEQANIEQAKVIRFGRRQSGVSRNNRVGERHRSLFGSFWKSYDFAGNQGRQNIFNNPIDFAADGGEYVFHLPNGLQGYYIATADGRRLDQAPSNIVRDLETAGKDPVIVNGLSCIACHSVGMKVVADQVRPHLDTLLKSDTFDLDMATSLYKPADVLSQAFSSDMSKFQVALKKLDTDLVPNPKDEPTSKLARYYLDDEGSISLNQAAADTGLTPKELVRRVNKSSRLESLGFNQLTVEDERNRGIKRDLWEENFGLLTREIAIGDFVAPTRTVTRGGGTAPSAAPVRLTSIHIGNITCDDSRLMERIRTNLVFWLSRSQQVKLVRVSTDADAILRGRIDRKDGELTLTLTEDKRKLREDITGLTSDLDFLTQQVADRMHHQLTGERLQVADSVGQATTVRATERVIVSSPSAAYNGASVTTRPAPVQTFIPRDPIATLSAQLPTRGLAVSVDRGPNSEYRFGEEVVIGVRSDRAGFLTIYNIDSQGTVALLFPNQFVQNNRVQAGQLISIGGPTAPFQITAQGVPGRETVVAVISDEAQAARLPGVSDFRSAPGSKSLGVVARGVDTFRSDLGKSLGVEARATPGNTTTPAPPAGVAQAIVQFFTVR